MAEEITNWRSYMSALRWAGLEDFLLKLAIDMDVSISTKVVNNFLRQTVYFEVIGNSRNVWSFKDSVIKSIKEYNSWE
jgi:hypothetical protein